MASEPLFWGRISNMCRSHPCGQTREAPRIPPVPPECVPWTQTGLLAEATVVARRGVAECPRTRPGACGLSPSLVRPPPRCRRVCGGALTPSRVLGCVTFSVSHQPALHIVAGSHFPSPPVSALGAWLCFPGRQQFVPQLPPSFSCRTTLYYSTQGRCAICRDSSFWSLHQPCPPPRRRGPAGLDTQELGLGCGLAALLPSEFGEARGAGGPLGGPPGPSLHGCATAPWFGCMCWPRLLIFAF